MEMCLFVCQQQVVKFNAAFRRWLSGKLCIPVLVERVSVLSCRRGLFLYKEEILSVLQRSIECIGTTVFLYYCVECISVFLYSVEILLYYYSA